MEEKKMEEKLEKILYNVDFSKDSDLKERLARRLFETQSNRPGNVRPFRSGSKSHIAMPLTDDEAELVSAAAALESDYLHKENPLGVLPGTQETGK